MPEKADTAAISEGSSCAWGLSGSAYYWETNRRGEPGVAADIGRRAPHSVVKAPLPRPAVELFNRRTVTFYAVLDDSLVYRWGGIRTPDGVYALGPIRLTTGTSITDIPEETALAAAGRLVCVEPGPYNLAIDTVSVVLTVPGAHECAVAVSDRPHGIDCWVTAIGAAYCLSTNKQAVQITQK